ncbi:hypothetical protein RvY_03423 [Ramazzottius varieornatus]|uniref:ADP-ribosylhydrolase ARH3 n=1 Tax=Ramazzottius varieornatus TaxID=947166 RepID=A0A1D1UN22_RAMVA|nr:hypothetical protein RvY_03423 [Ramazzottius varieornatus]
MAMGEDNGAIKRDVSLLQRYKGSFSATLIGNWVGVIFERPGNYMKSVDPARIEDAIHKQISDPSRAPLPYSDDSAMAHALIDSLLRCDEFNPTDVAIQFTNKFTREVSKQKMYANVKLVFKTWQKTNFKSDTFLAAKKQFEGGGSLGNGGGMRIVGVPLFHGRDLDAMIDLTHTHPIGYNGAILQAYAAHLALFSSLLDVLDFVDELLTFCETKLEVE